MKEMLVIESEAYKGILSSALKEDGYNVSEALDCKSAIELIKRSKYDIALIDINIAGEEDFFSVYRQYAKDTVLIVTCDKKDIEDKLFPLYEEAQDIIIKPYSIDAVVKNISLVKEKYRSKAYKKTLVPYIKSSSSFKVPSEKIFIQYLSLYIDNFLHANAFDDISSFRVAFEEALTNAVVHGNNLDKKKFVKVEILADGKEATVSIENEGDGFDYYTAMLKFSDSQENIFTTGGRGLFLISLYTDDFYFEYEGRRIILKKSR